MVISAVVTPDASPITMLLMFAAMVALYEGSLLISRVVLAKRIKKLNDQLAEEERAEAEEAAKAAAQQAISNALEGKTVRKVIYVAGRLVNIVAN